MDCPGLSWTVMDCQGLSNRLCFTYWLVTNRQTDRRTDLHSLVLVYSLSVPDGLCNVYFQPLFNVIQYMSYMCTYQSITKPTKRNKLIYFRFHLYLNSFRCKLNILWKITTVSEILSVIRVWRMEQQCLGNLLHGQNVYHCRHQGHHFRTFNSADAVQG